ncbi:MAG: hypothetical protein K2G52_01815 [Muribaculaceae bacterium]|nr:hypothetical protein [Muribaculaceae bacterium]
MGTEQKYNTESNTESKKSGKTRYRDLSKFIIEFCHDWKSAKEIANAKGYNPRYISGEIIPRMIADGLLEPYDKQSPKSPEQKYRAIPQN